jgi:hypothetical protein
MYVNWSDHPIADTGVGLQVETALEGSNVETDEIDSTQQKAAGRDKGGTKSNGSPNNGKKGKKRR